MIKVESPEDWPTRMTSRMIVQKALERHWQPYLYIPNSGHIRLVKPDGKQLEIFTALPPTTTHIAAQNCDDKYLTHLILQEHNLPVLPTFLCETDDRATAAAEQILSTNAKVVVKPLDAAHGNGVTVGLTNVAAVLQAAHGALNYSTKYVVQAFLPDAIDVRVLCIDGKYIAALQRVPARVKGDGRRSVAELIAHENQTNRALQYTGALAAISPDRAADYLGTAIHDVPAAGAYVSVLGTANVGTGGETVDVTDMLPEWLKRMAEQAATVLNLPVCGVDFLLSTPVDPDLEYQEGQLAITELNKNPSLYIHELPNHGTARPAVDCYLDYLDSL
jgi:cyanophycin synthetase